MRRLAIGVALITATATVLGCSRRSPSPVETSAARPPLSTGGDGKLAPNDPKHGTRRLIGLDAPVFVDGAQVAVLRAGEMPDLPRVKGADGALGYRLYDYFKAIGVAPEAIRSVHLHGNGDRIASVEGSELSKEKERFVFSYLGGETGVPVQDWDTGGLKNEFVIHEIRRVTVYAKKPAPLIHAKRQCHVGPDGQCTEEIPYADGVLAKGTRVYLDGKMVGFVKRRLIADSVVLRAASGDGDETRFSLAKLIASMGVDLSAAKSVEMMAGDDVIGRATGEHVASLLETSFTLPKHNHGKVRLRVPAELQAQLPGVKERDALVSAVLVYANTARRAPHSLVAISEDTDLSVELAAMDVGSSGEKLGRGDR